MSILVTSPMGPKIMKQSSDKVQNPQQMQQQDTRHRQTPKNAKKTPAEPGPATQWPGPLDRPLGFSER